ncbi:MAG TPA: ribosome recycling factor [Candidatus Fimimonas merdipullorum]|uniref:Ribosome-recycling factor n=1 Tax=Candidatus Fimimonas merdipullorum TaxID=2840822 RepID=A0A9D1MX28_9BACT|nr:ribosome recycling factor [Candidatus Fimimonas merdipullorum]
MNYATPQIEELFLNFDMECEKAIEYTKGEYNLMRAGRANPKLVENIKVDYYGAPTPINQMGNISIPEPRCLVISLWDKSALKLVEKAILSANIGVTPQNDGTVIRLTFPVLTEERRKELVKQVKKLAEDTKVVLRNARRSVMDGLKKEKAAKTVSEDLISDYEQEVDKQLAKQIEAVDKLAKEKEADVMSV